MDLEEMLQRGLAEKSERNKRSLAGGQGSDSDSYDEADMDDGFDDIGTSNTPPVFSFIVPYCNLTYIWLQ